jgi:hypothetical protein
LIADFTAWTMAYAPRGSGGAGFMGHLLVNQCATLVVASIAGAGAGGLDKNVIWTVVLASNGALALSLAAFFATINRSHVSAFFSSETLADQCERLFYEHTEPELKLQATVNRHETAYRHFRNDIKEFVESNIAEWESERPLWWTDTLLVRVPEDMLGGVGGASALRRKRALEVENKGGGGGRRNSMSLKRSLGIEDDDDEGAEGGGGRVLPVS